MSDEHAESNAIEVNAVPKITLFIILQFFLSFTIVKFIFLLFQVLSFAIYSFIFNYFKLYLLRLKALFSDVNPLTYNVFIHIRPIINSYIEAGTAAGIVSASSIILVIRNDEVEIDDEMHITEMTLYGYRVNLC